MTALVHSSRYKNILLEHVYMRPEVNSNRFEIYMEISLRQLSKQYHNSIAHVQMISFN